jgi:hypothetical protein
MQYLGGMEPLVGFDWASIDRALVFGNPPSMGTIMNLSGGYDPNQVVSAFEARDYTTETQGDVTLLCAANGCDSGQKINLTKRDPANPFGGELGREEPIALLSVPHNTIANSPDYALLSAMLQTNAGEQPSLADDKYIQAATLVIASSSYSIRQVQIFNGVDVGEYSAMPTPEGSEQPELLPAYSLAFFADTYERDLEQRALVGLVYDDAESANMAVALLLDRLQMAESMVANQPYMQMIEERGGHIAGATVEADIDRGKYVALLDIRYPAAPNEKGDAGYPASSLIFKLLIDSIYRRDAVWLAADFTGTS